jgi:hypothetical protein
MSYRGPSGCSYSCAEKEEEEVQRWSGRRRRRRRRSRIRNVGGRELVLNNHPAEQAAAEHRDGGERRVVALQLVKP